MTKTTLMKPNLIVDKSYLFAEQIVYSYKTLIYSKKEYILSKQMLRAGTSVGANVSEALYGQSRKDFISKLSIARKEANETKYWIHLLSRTGFLETNEARNLLENCEELLRILTSIIQSTQENKGT